MLFDIYRGSRTTCTGTVCAQPLPQRVQRRDGLAYHIRPWLQAAAPQRPYFNVQTQHLAPAEKFLEPLPHEPYVKLNRPCRKSAAYIVHSKTLERVVLPGDAIWHIVFDSDGFGAVESEANEVLFVDELFRLVVCRGDSGELMVGDRTKVGFGR